MLTPSGTATPAAREDHTWTVDAESKVAYLFGGRDGARELGDLWSFDLATDTWRALHPTGEPPAARFGHTATWVPDIGLVVWSGQAGGEFFDDIRAYDPAANAWRQLPSTGDVPARRYGSCASIGPDGRLWISHGFTDTGRFSDSRTYDFGTGAWTDVTPPGDVPVERCLHDCFWTPMGKLVLYGGQTDGVAALGDAWTLTAGVDGPATWAELPKPEPPARQLYAVAEAQGRAYVFGGSDVDRNRLDDLWSMDLADLSWRQEAAQATTRPAARAGSTLIADPARSRLLLWGGKTADRSLGDLWQYVLGVGG